MTELSDLSLTGAVGSRDPHVPSQAPFPWQGVLHRIKSSNNMRWLITIFFLYFLFIFFYAPGLPVIWFHPNAASTLEGNVCCSVVKYVSGGKHSFFSVPGPCSVCTCVNLDHLYVNSLIPNV